ncbi:MAG: enoyl-CoA hydratase-related protein [Bacteroidota bacterium]
METILLQKENGVATITLNRPDAANGLNLKMAQELYDASNELDQDNEIRAVILTANGKLFSAGGDLKYMAQNGKELGVALKKMATTAHNAIAQFARMNKPLIVGVNGTAAGIGFSLAMIGDLVIAAESAKFTMAYTAAGLSPDGGSTYLLPRLIGIRKTTELMLTNRRLSAAEALDWGLLNQVVTDDQLATTVQKLATQLANGPTPAFGSVKKLLLSTFHNSLETQMELEGRAIVANATSPHGTEGIHAFLEKRKPKF